MIKDIQIPEPVHQTFCIVGIQQVKKNIVGLLHIHRIAVIHHILKVLFFHRPVDEKIVDSAHQRIIHHGIILVPHEPLAGIVPDLS